MRGRRASLNEMSALCKSRLGYIATIIFFASGTVTILEYSTNGGIPILGVSSSLSEKKQICMHQCCPFDDYHLHPNQDVHTLSSAKLDDLSAKKYHECVATKSALSLWKERKQSQKTCYDEITFLNRTAPIVALVSFPGSGNSWVRHLLEQATGVYTGSIYCDTSLKPYFPGEYIVSGNVLVVKTHHSDSPELPKSIQKYTGKKTFDMAILLVRNPYDALVSEANRRWSKTQRAERHLGLAEESTFIDNKKWEWFVEYKGIQWFMTLNNWLKESKLPVLPIQYENIKLNVSREVKKMTDFLGMSVSKERLDCVSSNYEGQFQRHKHISVDPYTPKLKTITNDIIDRGNVVLGEFGIKYKHR